MASGKGAICLNCGEQTSHDEGSHRLCSNCGSVSWDLSHANYEIGRGKGKKCRHCGNETLHWIANVPNTEDQEIRRCSICNAVLITGNKS